MKTSVEISYYPLNNEYIPPIKDFIDRLNRYDQLIVKTNGMSTQVFGEYFEVMNILTNEIHKSFELPHSVFVMKVINADLNIVSSGA
jgi:uncharacterized protein YqgV (UPF0045/DUF77 family)